MQCRIGGAAAHGRWSRPNRHGRTAMAGLPWPDCHGRTATAEPLQRSRERSPQASTGVPQPLGLGGVPAQGLHHHESASSASLEG